MSSNEKAMTLEERIVQSLKDDSLMKLVGDEDAITELVKRAISEALFQPQRFQKQYGGWDQTDSIVVATARKVADNLAETAMKKMAAELLEDPAVRKATLDALIACMPSAIENRSQNMVYTAAQQAKADAIFSVQEAIRNRVIQLG